MILNSYKAKSGKSRVMFLLSSESFFQAYKRVQYMKQFALFRKNQAIKISALVKELASLNDRLKSQKDKKEELLKTNRSVQKTLEDEKDQSNTIAIELRRIETVSYTHLTLPTKA